MFICGELGAKPIDVLLTPTKIYVKSILELIKKVNVKGIAHITGGGFIENSKNYIIYSVHIQKICNFIVHILRIGIIA